MFSIGLKWGHFGIPIVRGYLWGLMFGVVPPWHHEVIFIIPILQTRYVGGSLPMGDLLGHNWHHPVPNVGHYDKHWFYPSGIFSNVHIFSEDIYSESYTFEFLIYLCMCC